jgi:hypothetical protein
VLKLYYLAAILCLQAEKVAKATQQKGTSMKKLLTRKKAAETTKQKEEKRKKHEPEEQECMPQHQHCPLAKRRGNRNPKYHEKQQKDVA